MIEVEIRGRLSEDEYIALRKTFAEKGRFIEHLEREMILLRGYPGYEESSLSRQMDIRLRNTNGRCEIMAKRNAGENNVGREEISLELHDNTLETAKRMMKALGFEGGLRMIRIMDLYKYASIHWQVIATPKGLWYYEAEQEAHSDSEVSRIEQHLRSTARSLGLSALQPHELQEFNNLLDKEVNEEVMF